MDVTVNLHLNQHCIETEAKREYCRLMDAYFDTDDVEGVLEERIELLRDFLEKSDFLKLRSSDPRLSGDRKSKVVIKRAERGEIVLNVY
ncbi:MAG: hypothetical protein E4G96_10750 [Chrysiogenales bacterium]|nr:MAG: hypothetical protein E4G96_10750 [Chrysiogenales bacterium]